MPLLSNLLVQVPIYCGGRSLLMLIMGLALNSHAPLRPVSWKGLSTLETYFHLPFGIKVPFVNRSLNLVPHLKPWVFLPRKGVSLTIPTKPSWPGTPGYLSWSRILLASTSCCRFGLAHDHFWVDWIVGSFLRDGISRTASSWLYAKMVWFF